MKKCSLIFGILPDRDVAQTNKIKFLLCCFCQTAEMQEQSEQQPGEEKLIYWE